MAIDELQTFLVGESSLTEDDLVYPMNCTWTMGFNWNSCIAQSVIVSACGLAGIADDQFLSDEQQILWSMHEIVAVVTDDIMHLGCVGPELGCRSWSVSGRPQI